MKHAYYLFTSYLNILRKDLRQKFPLSFFLKLKLWRRGFLAEKYALYQLDHNSIDLYLSDHHASMARWINEPFVALLTNKFIFSEVVGRHIRVPVTFGSVIGGVYYPNNGTSLEQVIAQQQRFVVKAINGGGGKNVFIVENNGSVGFSINGAQEISRTEFDSFVATLNNFIVTEFVSPGDFALSLNDQTVNTMRVVTLLDPETNQAFIAGAVQRIGVKKSMPMDNFTRGGLAAMIDLETGVLSSATAHPDSLLRSKYSNHPETGAKIEGALVPGWEALKSEILSAASSLPMLKCVGWDFLLTSNGLVAIEGNHHPDPDVLQAHKPLLLNDKVRSFYQFHKVL